MYNLTLTIFNNNFEVNTANPEIHNRLSLDFQKFLTPSSIIQTHFQIQVQVESPPWHKLPKNHLIKRSHTSIIYEVDRVRYNDYHGSALSIFDYNTNEAIIYAEDLHLAHELSYLLILSRSAKSMDLTGHHKIHAMGIQLNETNALFIAPSGGGKSTLFLELLKDARIKIFSDDTPVVDSSGFLYAFPLRVGLESKAKIPSFINPSNTYRLLRRKFGEKTLIPLASLNREVALFKDGQKIVLLIGKRVVSRPARLVKIHRLRLLPELTRSMIIGVGLPMILEYFFETGPTDILKRFVIILKRTNAALSLLYRSETYQFQMSPDAEDNADKLKALMERLN